MTEPATHPLLKTLKIEALAEISQKHQFNDNAIRNTRSLGDLVGMTDLGVHLVRIEPGRESTQFHTHQQDEEFLYILSGRGLADIGDESFEVETGDFMGFTANALPHSMSNPYDEDLVYLMCGTRKPIDICDYPRIQRRMYRIDGIKEYADWEDIHTL